MKTKDPNAKGIYDMSGNVYELCWDSYGNDSSSLWVQRGGSWNNNYSRCIVVDRDYFSPGSRLNVVGFRVARNAN